MPKKLGVKSAKELSGATICVGQGTTTELNLSDYFRSNKGCANLFNNLKILGRGHRTDLANT